ncbi:hypothetical protein F5X99DRAFT_58478 [Biscogniauxia marginata]|nr:hypothetical protein F5X99DRAFT_58478 [Biscogniauxia marginata]
MATLIRRRALRVPVEFRVAATLRSTPIYQTQTIRYASSLPSVVQLSFWKSMVPKPLRRRPEPSSGAPTKPKSKEWNPATFFILIFILIGSMSIQMITLRKDFDTFVRRADVRIGLLREVVEKLQKGEEVDVEKALGTGDVEKEREWEEVLKEIEQGDIVKNARKTERPKPPPAAPTRMEQKPESAATRTPDRMKAKTTGYSNFF